MLNSTAVMNTESIAKRQERNAHREDVVGQIGCYFHFGRFWEAFQPFLLLIYFSLIKISVIHYRTGRQQEWEVGKLGLGGFRIITNSQKYFCWQITWCF